MKKIDNYLDQIKIVCELYEIWNLLETPQVVFGWLLHSMFKINTDKWLFAVKILNNEIMKRPWVLENFNFSEKVSNLVKGFGVNSVSAINVWGKYIQNISNDYIIVFDWVDWLRYSEESVPLDIAYNIGISLWKIHNIQIDKKLSLSKSITYNNLTQDDKMFWINLWDYKINKIILELIDKYSKAVDVLNWDLLISHRDIDQKNVLWWKGNIPYIVDWESVWYINPTMETISAALNWWGLLAWVVKKEVFFKLIEWYITQRKLNLEHILPSFYAYAMNMIDWLKFNIDRSNKDIAESEKEIANNEITKTTKSLELFNWSLDIYCSWIEEVKEIINN